MKSQLPRVNRCLSRQCAGGESAYRVYGIKRKRAHSFSARQIRGHFPGASASRPEHLRLLQDPKWGTLFDSVFHCDRGGTVRPAMLAVFLEAKIGLTCNWQHQEIIG